jgi:Erv1 / Alr family
MTVGVVEFNSRVINEDANKYVILNAPTVADVLRYFVKHFLLCEVCKNHFLEEYDACKYDRCNRFPPKEIRGELKDWKQLPLWLLETHNGVNVRLQSERAGGVTLSSAQQQNVMWPPTSDCPRCWLEQNGAASATRYNQTVMYEYLRLTYW